MVTIAVVFAAGVVVLVDNVSSGSDDGDMTIMLSPSLVAVLANTVPAKRDNGNVGIGMAKVTFSFLAKCSIKG
jgi:hypothetical protein